MARRNSGGRFAWLWMVLAVLAIGGFMAWLGVNSQTELVAVVEEEEAPVDFAAAEVVTLDDLAAEPTGYLNRALRLDDLPVSSRLGDQAFWAVASNGTPFLVKLGSELVQGGFAVRDGESVTVVGQVREVSVELLDGWERDGVLRTPEDRMVAEFAVAYLDVVQAAHTASAGSDD
jgi:hypothetical protein